MHFKPSSVHLLCKSALLLVILMWFDLREELFLFCFLKPLAHEATTVVGPVLFVVLLALNIHCRHGGS
jgi:hypothetical protein